MGIVRLGSKSSLGIVLLLLLLAVACGTAATATPLPKATSAPAPTALAAPAQPTPTAAPKPTSNPAPVVVKDKVILVLSAEPGSLDPWDTHCNATLEQTICNETANEPLTWITSDTFKVVPLSGVEGWQQLAPDRWRFTLRRGVKFHNGEPWNAKAAETGIDLNGDGTKAIPSFSYHGAISAETVDEYTLDIVCKVGCPILPRSMIFTRFQAPQWYAAATAEQRARTTVGIGPYKVLEWRPGVDVRLEAYDGYVPNPSTVDAQAPKIKNLVTVWRNEALVRTAMVGTGEADWAPDIGFDNKKNVPQWKQSTTTEVFMLIPDLMWHPELKKKAVREALNLAIDCPAITKAMLDGLPCWGAVSPAGTVGITPRNSAPYPYNPAKAKQLLKDAGYDPKNEINIYTADRYCCRNLEFMEAVVNYWKEVGVNSKMVVVERNKYRDMTSSGCGRFNKEPGYEAALDCSSRPPPAPYLGTTHTTVTSSSNEMLDHQVQAERRMGCFNASTRVCFREVQQKIDVAKATAEGPERTRLMAEILDIAHDEFYFIPFIQVQLVYGLAKNLEWEPLYAPRIRVNTMKFK